MPMRTERRRLRIPLVAGDNLIDTGWADAIIYDRTVAVHPKPGAHGMFTVTLAVSGEAVYHFDNEPEAKQFARDLVKEADRRHLRLDFDRHLSCPPQTREFLIGWCSGWKSRHLLYIQRARDKPLDQGVLFTSGGRRIV